MTTRSEVGRPAPPAGPTGPSTLRAPAAGRRSRGVPARSQLVVTPLIAVLALAVWTGAIAVFDIPSIVLPQPWDVVLRLVEMLQTPYFWTNLGVTISEFAVGFAIGALAAIAVGALFARVTWLEKGFSPYIVAFQNFPKIAIAPLFVTWFGFGITPKIVLAAILAFFPVFVNVIVGMKSSSREQLDLMRSLAATEWQTFWLLRLKVAMPYLFAGLRVAAVFSLLGAITGEFISSSKGLGYMLLQQNQRLAVDGAFALLVVMGFLGLAVHWILTYVHRRVVFWDESLNAAKAEARST